MIRISHRVQQISNSSVAATTDTSLYIILGNPIEEIRRNHITTSRKKKTKNLRIWKGKATKRRKKKLKFGNRSSGKRRLSITNNLGFYAIEEGRRRPGG